MKFRRRQSLMSAATLIAALVLSVFPLPESIAAYRPDWVALIMVYWSLVEPGRFGLVTAMLLGIALDTLTGSLLGQHSLALLVVVYLSQRFHLRIRAFPASQVALIAIALLGVYEFILFWIDGVAGRTVPTIERWAPVVSGAVIWLAVLVVLERSRSEAHSRVP
jgi:rod shape-determining protein MreD